MDRKTIKRYDMRKQPKPMICDPHQLALLIQGAPVWNAWRQANPNVPICLVGAPLSKKNLSGVDLSHADLRGADFLGADLSNAILNDADMSKAMLQKANLSEANLCRTTVTAANFWLANLTDANTVDIRYTKRGMRDKFLGVRGVESTWGDAVFKRMAADQSYIDSMHWHWHRNPFQRMLFFAWGWIDYGRGLYRILFMALLLISMFGEIYSHYPDMVGLNCKPTTDKCALHGAFTPFYFSVVTYTTLGFGDISAQTTEGEVAVAVEVLLGYLTLGLLSSVLADKVARRS
jgi:hypothetical protein